MSKNKRNKCLHLRLLGWDDGIAGDELGEDTTGGLDTESQGADIDEENIAGAFFAREDTTLEGSAPSDSLIGVDSLGGFLAVEEVLEEGLDLGDTGRATNEDNLGECLLGMMKINHVAV